MANWEVLPSEAYENLTSPERDAAKALTLTFKRYGLESLAPKILQFVRQGFASSTITLMLQETEEYKQRFKGNETRRTKGLPVLNPKEYLSLERQYEQILRSAGMPRGFYDSTDDFANWIGTDVSPNEIQERVSMAEDAVNNTDDDYIQSLRDYGLGEGDLIASMLDRNRALPQLKKTVRMAEIGASASRAGFELAAERAERFVDVGVDQRMAQQGYQQIAQNLPDLQELSQRYDEEYDREMMEAELFGLEGAGPASQRRRRLVQRERSQFAGRRGTGQRAFARRTTGQY